MKKNILLFLLTILLINCEGVPTPQLVKGQPTTIKIKEQVTYDNRLTSASAEVDEIDFDKFDLEILSSGIKDEEHCEAEVEITAKGNCNLGEHTMVFKFHYDYVSNDDNGPSYSSAYAYAFLKVEVIE